MSETEHSKGRLIPVFAAGNLENASKNLLRILGKEFKADMYTSFLEQIKDEGCREYFIGKDTIYLIEVEHLNPNDDIATAERLEGGEILFELKYYNGGAGFDEMMGSALKTLGT